MLDNRGSYLFTSDVSINGTGGQIINASTGTFGKTGGTGSSTVSTAFTNTGRIYAGSGTLNLPGLSSNAGIIELAGATLATSTLTNAGGGIIEGSGTVITPLLDNSGIVRPGGIGATGTLTVLGNYAQGASGTLEVELAGPTTYDVLSVSGNATLNGTLDIATPSYTPASGSVHGVVNYASGTGNFINFTGNISLVKDNQTNSYQIVGPLPGGFWDGGAGTLNWGDAQNWSTNVVPGASDDVQIPDLVGTPTILLGGGAYTVKSFTFMGDDNLHIDASGSLSFAQASSIVNARLAVLGTLSGTGPLTVKQLEMIGGMLNTTGALNVSHSFTQTGGVFQPTGAVSINQASGALTLANPLNVQSLTLSAPTGDLTVNQVVSAGTVDLRAGGTISQTGDIAAPALVAQGDHVELINTGNAVGTLAGEATNPTGGRFHFGNATALHVDTVNGVSGVSVKGDDSNGGGLSIVLTGAGSTLTLNQGLRVDPNGVSNGSNISVVADDLAINYGNGGSSFGIAAANVTIDAFSCLLYTSPSPRD